MKRTDELLKNTLFISIGRVSTQVIAFLLLPLYTVYLSTDEFGKFDYILTLVSFIVPVSTFLMEESMFRFLIDCKTEEEKETIISHTFIFCSFNVILLLILGVIFNKIFKIDSFTLVSICVIAQTTSALSNALSRGTSNIPLYSFSNFLSSLIMLSLNILFAIYFKLGYLGLVSSIVISNLLTSIIVFYKLKLSNYLRLKNIQVPLVKSMLKYSIPMVPNSLSWVIINLSDRLVIVSFLGTSYNGLYSLACKFPSIITTFYGFFNLAWREVSAKIVLDKDEKEFYKIYCLIRRILFTTTICLISSIQFVYPIVINERYYESLNYIPILSISAYYLALAGFFGGIFTAYKDTNILASTSITASLMNLLIDISLINFIGIYAASIASFCAAYFLYMYRRFKIKKYFDYKDNVDNRVILCFAILLSIFYYLPCNIIVTILVLTLSCYFNRDILYSIYFKMRNLFYRFR